MKYPNGLAKEYNNQVNYKNRGMNLEDDLNQTNNYYLVTDRAVIYKKPTPVTIVKVDFKSREDAVIKEAYFKTPSTTDYNGIYNGKYIDFEAKETLNTEYFPLRNIHAHQIEHLKKVLNHGGIAFLIVRFTNLNITYFLEAKYLLEFIEKNTRKSIPVSYFESKGYVLQERFNPRLDYLRIIDIIYFEKGELVWKMWTKKIR